MKSLAIDQINSKIKKIKFEPFDLIIAIGEGGIIPAILIANQLKLDVNAMQISFRGKNNKPLYKKPRLIGKIKKIRNKKILIVDDVSRTGATLKKAKELLKNNSIKTFVINGKADYSLYHSKECIKLPWHNPKL